MITGSISVSCQWWRLENETADIFTDFYI